MRIVHFIDSLHFGGLQTVVMGLSLALKERGHFVEIACLRGRGNNPAGAQSMSRAGVNVVGPFRNLTGWVVLETVHKVTRYLKEQRFDIVHSHNPFCQHYVTAAARLAGLPTVNTLHATAMFPRMKREEKALFWGASLFTDRVISVCKEVQTTLGDRFKLPTAKLTTVENGIDLDEFLAVPRRAPREPVVFGAIGRMTPVKNHRVLIEAFALVRAKYPGIRLRILGGGPLEEQLRGVANNLGLSESVELCGFDSDVAGFLSSIDVFALSSNSEGLPMSLLEAIASGLPVIATSVGGVPDVIRKTGSGWLAPPGEAAGLMKAMESAIQCPDRVAHGEKARRIVAEAYSSARMSADYERVYETLLRK